MFKLKHCVSTYLFLCSNETKNFNLDLSWKKEEEVQEDAEEEGEEKEKRASC